MTIKEKISQKYPHASFCTFGDSAALADHLATLIATGVKTASCGSLAGCIEDNAFPMIGEYKIVENSRGEPVCVIRVIGLHLLRFSDVTAELARKEGKVTSVLNIGVMNTVVFSRQKDAIHQKWTLSLKNMPLLTLCR